MKLVLGLLRGAAAGAAGTTALNASSYADMAARGRPASSAPEDVVEKLAGQVDLEIPGHGDERENRVSGLGALSGILVGIGVGAGLGAAQAAGRRPRVLVSGLVAAAAAIAITDGPMALLGVTNPRKWSTTDWLSDALPHLAYGYTTAATLHRWSGAD